MFNKLIISSSLVLILVHFGHSQDQISPDSISVKALNTSVIHAKSAGDDLAPQVLEGKAWQKEMQASLGESLKNQAMVSVRSMGPAPARPVIRGLGNERVQIRESGHGVTDLSATSPDHAVSMETARIKKIELVRGPKLLLTQSSALGASVEIETGLIPIDPFEENPLKNDDTSNLQSRSEFQNSFETANLGWMTRLGNESQWKNSRFVFNGSIRQASDLQTPEAKLNNTQFENQDLAIGNSTQWEHLTLGFSFSNFATEYGIPGGFLGGHANGVLVNMLRRTYSSLLHYHTHNDNDWIQQFNLSYDRTYFNQREIENGFVGAEFAYWNHEAQFKLDHKGLNWWTGGSSSFSYVNRLSEVGGYVFTPPTQMNRSHAALLENFAWGDFHLAASTRLENTLYDPKSVSTLINSPKRSFLTSSSSIQPHIHWDHIEWQGIFSTNQSAPSLEQLYNQGPHLAAYSYETGNSALGTENGLSYETEFSTHFWGFKMKAAAFYYDFAQFFEMAPTGKFRSQDGSNLPIFSVNAIPAQIWGGEINMDQKLNSNWSISSQLSRTRGERMNNIEGTTQKRALSSIPAFKENLAIQYKYKSFDLQFSVNHFHSQYRVSEFEDPTKAAWVYNTLGSYGFPVKSTWSTVVFGIENITNSTYRNHLSRIRSISPEQGINFKTNYKLEF